VNHRKQKKLNRCEKKTNTRVPFAGIKKRDEEGKSGEEEKSQKNPPGKAERQFRKRKKSKKKTCEEIIRGNFSKGEKGGKEGERKNNTQKSEQEKPHRTSGQNSRRVICVTLV